MKTFTEEELKKVIENHKHWLLEDCNGWEDMRADLTGADLTGADLTGADLRGANLRWADLTGADLTGAGLYRADLTGADLTGANLTRADLRGAYLTGANLRDTDLTGANLVGADLVGADLVGADLTGANLNGANLRWANLTGADLRGADLTEAKNAPYFPMACPDEGAFIGWKQCRNSKIVELCIPEDARRSSATGRKCRCDKAVVMSITSPDGSKSYSCAYSVHDPDFKYVVGETVTVQDFDENRFAECAPGIHFFMNRQEAVDYT